MHFFFQPGTGRCASAGLGYKCAVLPTLLPKGIDVENRLLLGTAERSAKILHKLENKIPCASALAFSAGMPHPLW